MSVGLEDEVGDVGLEFGEAVFAAIDDSLEVGEVFWADCCFLDDFDGEFGECGWVWEDHEHVVGLFESVGWVAWGLG